MFNSRGKILFALVLFGLLFTDSYERATENGKLVITNGNGPQDTKLNAEAQPIYFGSPLANNIKKEAMLRSNLEDDEIISADSEHSVKYANVPPANKPAEKNPKPNESERAERSDAATGAEGGATTAKAGAEFIKGCLMVIIGCTSLAVASQK